MEYSHDGYSKAKGDELFARYLDELRDFVFSQVCILQANPWKISKKLVGSVWGCGRCYEQDLDQP